MGYSFRLPLSMERTVRSATKSEETKFRSRDLRASLYAFVFSRVKNHALSEDLTQEILIKVARNQSTLRDANRLEGWIFRIARNRLNDHFRASRGGSEVFDENVHALPETDDQQHEALKAEEADLRRSLQKYIRRVVEELPPHYRDALLATEFEGLSQVAYAKRAGLSVPAAKSRVQRGRKEVRRIFEECCEVEADPYGNIIDAIPRAVPEKRDPDCRCGSTGDA